MQNIPGIALEKAEEQIAAVKIAPAKKRDQQELFADLFNEHADMVENELALAPVSHNEKMLDAVPHAETREEPVNAAGTKVPVKDNKEKDIRDNEARVTEDDFEELKDDLKGYGMSDEEIARLEDKVKSEKGMTWGQMAAAIAQKMAATRTAEMTDDQKVELKSFFSKFGFTEKESDKLIAQLEKGNFSKVMKELQTKVDSMPQDKSLLLEKTEIEAFAAALAFSKEFTAKIKEMLGNNALPKDMKEAFTLIRQEMADMDKKDQELARAVGKVFARAMGDESKATTAARQITEAVDLKPRVSDEQIETEAKEELAEAVKVRKDAMPEASTRKTATESMANKVEIKPEADPKTATDKQEDDSEENWDNLFGKMRDDSGSTGKEQGTAQTQAQAQTESSTLNALTKTNAAEMDSKAKAWEKVSAPKVMKQVDNAIFKTLNNGTKQLTLQLTPENLGKLSIVLQVSGKEVGATIRAENADAAKIIADNIDILKSSLESHGLKVDKLEVQTGLTGNQDYQDWFGENEHNLAREREAMIAMRNHMKQMREGKGGVLAQDLQQLRDQAIHADHGLHIIA
ncbi:flagellar hook-length control protein FliK [Pseudodesulfovibrio portus]|uniref:Flagellar hook-length control protein-like C-terminal domain-containing protein n=1 Tax=Pseudodesulfovibrio portus TaxID=231439 RepID=A0ABN6RXN4_9BACT|nr:flagellar hook-length control protein FliK [Pseudodesulfovibrio portus]BDQ34651.1 hypothetical protein JCM14722_21930 [Pseudodesulfovibrio portus]